MFLIADATADATLALAALTAPRETRSHRRVAERALAAQERPVFVQRRLDLGDPQMVSFRDEADQMIHAGEVIFALDEPNGRAYLSAEIRNVGRGVGRVERARLIALDGSTDQAPCYGPDAEVQHTIVPVGEASRLNFIVDEYPLPRWLVTGFETGIYFWIELTFSDLTGGSAATAWVQLSRKVGAMGWYVRTVSTEAPEPFRNLPVIAADGPSLRQRRFGSLRLLTLAALTLVGLLYIVWTTRKPAEAYGLALLTTAGVIATPQLFLNPLTQKRLGADALQRAGQVSFGLATALLGLAFILYFLGEGAAEFGARGPGQAALGVAAVLLSVAALLMVFGWLVAGWGSVLADIPSRMFDRPAEFAEQLERSGVVWLVAGLLFIVGTAIQLAAL